MAYKGIASTEFVKDSTYFFNGKALREVSTQTYKGQPTCDNWGIALYSQRCTV